MRVELSFDFRGVTDDDLGPNTDLEVHTGFSHPFNQMHVVPDGTVLATKHSS